ncbi:MAG: DUF116 domain-containing protein [Elusimicrobiota bacterium]
MQKMEYKKLVQEKNKKYLKKFLQIPTNKKVILMPQCLRNIKKCKAKEFGSYYLCAECGGCKISKISQIAKSNGYLALRILKGGSIVKKMVAQLNPKAILGIACYFEGAHGIKECEKWKIPVYFYPLSKDGCENTDFEVDELMELLEKKNGK